MKEPLSVGPKSWASEVNLALKGILDLIEARTLLVQEDGTWVLLDREAK